MDHLLSNFFSSEKNEEKGKTGNLFGQFYNWVNKGNVQTTGGVSSTWQISQNRLAEIR